VDAEAAYEDGLAWIGEGARPAARQCTALALVALGHAAEGAIRLEELAKAKNTGSLEQRYIYLIQAGHAWLLAQDPEAALTAFDSAGQIRAADPDLAADRAAALMRLGRWEEAGEALDEAVAQRPSDGVFRKLRAEVHLAQGDLDAAEADIYQAIASDAEDIDAYVLRGRVNEARRIRAADPTFEPIIRTGDE
ncbi:MAG: tetratricopeptide repeat protein, partial [Pseudomonadota bacterium]